MSVHNTACSPAKCSSLMRNVSSKKFGQMGVSRLEESAVQRTKKTRRQETRLRRPNSAFNQVHIQDSPFKHAGRKLLVKNCSRSGGVIMNNYPSQRCWICFFKPRRPSGRTGNTTSRLTEVQYSNCCLLPSRKAQGRE